MLESLQEMFDNLLQLDAFKFDAFKLEWRDPWLLWVALVAPVIYLLASRATASVLYSSTQLLQRAPRSLRARLARVPAILLALASLLIAVALAGPRVGDAQSRIKREGIAIALVIDVSSSMRALDLDPENDERDRLDVVKGVVEEFVTGGKEGSGRPDDLLGIVKFGGFADSICPLTLDHGSVVSMIGDLEPYARNTQDDGTAIGEGLALALERLRREENAKSKVAILLTDGENNSGEISPNQAAELAAKLGIRVYVVGAGTRGSANYPLIDDHGRVQIRQIVANIDDEGLEQIANVTGGRYYRATNVDGLKGAYAEIDALERSEIREIRYLQYEEHYQLFVLGALICVAISGLLAGTWLRRLP